MHTHDIPVIDILPVEAGAGGGVQRYWNAADPVLTHLFDALVCADRYIVDFCQEVCQRVLEQEEALRLSLRVVNQLSAWSDQTALIRLRYEDHYQWLLEHGFEEAIPQRFTSRFEHMLDSLSLPELVAVAAAHKWISHALCDYTLSQYWLLSQAQGTPGLLCRWEAVMELLHKSAFVDLANTMGLSGKLRRWAFDDADYHGTGMFSSQFRHGLSAAGSLRLNSLPGTLVKLYRILWAPGGGEAHVKRFRRLYLKKHDLCGEKRHQQLIDDWLINNKSNFVQLNENVIDSNYTHSMFAVRDRAD